MEACGKTFRPFKCKHCKKRLHSMSALQQHSRLHNHSRPYQCNICSKTYRLLEQLKWHQQVHDEKPFICNWCEESFAEPFHLGQHLFRQHRIISNGLEFSPTRKDKDDPAIGSKQYVELAHDNNNSIAKSENGQTEKSHDMNGNACEVPDSVSSREKEVSNDEDQFQEDIKEAVDLVLSLNNELPNGGSDATNEESGILSDASGISDMDTEASKLTMSQSELNLNAANNLYQSSVDDMPGPSHQSQETTSCGKSLEKDVPSLSGQDSSVSLAMINDDSFIDEISPDTSKYMLRGDPSLHRCQSGEDLQLLSDSLMFTDEREAEVKSIDKNKHTELNHTNSWSSSTLSSFLIPQTPHKLSVDPGAGSLNASPAMSPFRASIGRGDSDDEELSDIEPLKETQENKANLIPKDKILSIVKVRLERIDKGGRVSPVLGGCSVKLPLNSNCFFIDKTLDPHRFSKNSGNGDSILERQPIEASEKVEKAPSQRNDQAEKLETQNSVKENHTTTAADLIAVKEKQSSDTVKAKRRSKSKSTTDCLTDNRGLKNQRKTRNKRSKSYSAIFNEDSDKDWDPGNDSAGIDTSQDEEWGPEKAFGASEIPKKESSNSSSSSERQNESDVLEYNLRPKRRKTFQSLFHETCDCCEHPKEPVQRQINVQNYMENVAKVENLRKQVTELIGTVFPNLQFPPRFSNVGLAVEYLVNEVTDAASERQRKKQRIIPYGSLDSDVKVVLCKHPTSCLRHFRKKIHKLLTTLLPDIASEDFEPTSVSVENLLTEVIDTNRKATTEQLKNVQ